MDASKCNADLVQSPFGGYLDRTELTLTYESSDILQYLRDCRPSILQILENRTQSLGAIKFWIGVAVTYHKSNNDQETIDGYLPNTAQTILSHYDISQSVDQSFTEIANEVENFEEQGSNWVLSKVSSLDLYTVGYTPLAASSFKFLPECIERKHAIVNVQNSDNFCFLWSILASTKPVKKNAERTSNYMRHMQTFNLDGLTFPMSIDQIPKFTQQNQISVNVFTCNDKERVCAIHRTTKRMESHVNLFYWDGHYSCIKHFDRLMGDQNGHKARSYFCDICLFPKYDAQRLVRHRETCNNGSLSTFTMPVVGDNCLKFKNVHKTIRKPVVVYADFEAILKPIHGCERNPNQSFTDKYQKHVPCSVGMVVSRSCCGDPKFDDLFIHTGHDPVTVFLEKLIQITNEYAATCDKYPLSMSDQDKAKFESAENCAVCEKYLGADRVRDHCHVCGKFRNALHNSCNQMLRLDREVVVVFHNLKRYDGHMIMRAIGEVCQNHNLKLSCVAKSMEDYVTFSLDRGRKDGHWKIRFIDSAQFLAGSLEQLAQQLKPEQFLAMRSFFPNTQLQILCRKGVFPYDYLDSWEKLSETHPIAREKFYNKLNHSHVSDIDYQHYLDVCSIMGTTTILEYLELYLKIDVLILADIFEEFRKFSMDNHILDSCHYSTLPGLSWDACLKKTKIELELLTDYDMYEFFEKGIRGGISVISKRSANANNQYIDTYTTQMLQSFIMYYDANNLYGWSMQEPLPTSDFRWLDDTQLASLFSDLMSIDPKGDVGYVLEVDLSYPHFLHDRHNCYPLAPEKLDIHEHMLSPYCKRIAKKHGLKLRSTKKLAPNLMDKEKYIVHFRNLQYYIKQGLVLTKIHRAIAFSQSNWIASYISFNTEKRKQAETELQKNLYKFYVNAFFGKTMENIRKYINIELVTDVQRLRKVTKKPQFQRAVIFTDHLVGCNIGRDLIQLNKPIYAGFSILELSKLLMYSFHYDHIVPTYGDKAELLMTDTDSLMYHLTTDSDVYLDMLENLELYDTSDYPPGHFLYSEKNKKQVGRMKDELNGIPIDSFVGLRSKMYSIRSGLDEKKRAKGIKRKVVRDELTHQDYYTTLADTKIMHSKMHTIRSDRHNLYSLTLNKKSLSCFDDKRHILDDGINTYAYGHYKIV